MTLFILQENFKQSELDDVKPCINIGTKIINI